MADWPYAMLTKAAKEAGGPEAWIKQIKDTARDAGISQGRKEGAIIACVVIAFLAACWKGIKFLIKFFGKGKNYEQEVEKAKEAEEKLIKGINEYDKSHQAEQTTIKGIAYEQILP